MALCVLTNVLSPASAHTLPSQPPFFKINGKLSGLYPIPAPAIASYIIPQDIAPEKYIVNQILNFEIDTSSLGMPKEIIDQTKFIWDYGDGISAEGLVNAHRYKKPGSYILSITLDVSAFSKTNKPQLFQSIMIHVLPNKTYKLPKAQIRVNNKISTDPFTDMFDVKTSSRINLDATASQNGSEEIISFEWSFGDGHSSNVKNTSHSYDARWSMLVPILRVTDKYGFINDTFVILRQNPNAKDTANILGISYLEKFNFLPFILVGGLIFLIMLYLFLSQIKKN